MSMILDALRKSEAERRRADVPDLFDEAPIAAPVRASGAPRAWLWAVAAIAVLLVGAFALRAALDPDAPASGVDRTDAAPTVADTRAAPDAAMPLPAPSSPPATVAIPAPAPTATPALAAPSTAPAAASQPVAAAPSTPPPAPTPAPAALPAPPLAAAATAGPAAIAPPSRAAPAVAPAVAPPVAPVAAATAPTFASPSAPLRLSDLSIEQRQQLPALKISMLMWNPSPDRRFAIVDGNRVAEGDRVGEAVVDAITEDGVVLGWQGQRLKVPIR